MTKKRFVERYAGRTIKRLIGIEDIETNRVCVTIEENIRLLNELNDVREQLIDENKQLKHNNRMLSRKMSEVYTNYRLLKEFSEDTNPNDAVKKVLSELMQITKEYR